MRTNTLLHCLVFLFLLPTFAHGKAKYIWEAKIVGDACKEGNTVGKPSELQLLDAGMCRGFVSAVEDNLEDAGYILEDSMDSQAVPVFTQYLDRHPELRTQSARSVMLSAWLEVGLVHHPK